MKRDEQEKRPVFPQFERMDRERAYPGKTKRPHDNGHTVPVDVAIREGIGDDNL